MRKLFALAFIVLLFGVLAWAQEIKHEFTIQGSGFFPKETTASGITSAVEGDYDYSRNAEKYSTTSRTIRVATNVHAVVAQPEPVRIAIDHLRNLEYDPAKQGLGLWLKEHPDDLYAWNYLATTTLYQEMFRQGVLESRVYGEGGEVFKASKLPVTPEFQKELLTILDKAQALADERLKKDPQDKDAMYWAGVTHGTRATYHFTLRKEYKPALREATAAYKHHDQLLTLDANYVDALLIVGVNNYVVGSLPWYLKVMASLTGRHGNKAEGLRQIQRAASEGRYASEDAQLILAVLYQREKMHREALPLYQEMASAYPRNYLLSQEVATLYGLVGEWRDASREYDAILVKKEGR